MDKDGEDDAHGILRKAFDITPIRVTRYHTGYCHRVFEVEQHNGTRVVLRLTSPENAAFHDGCRYWLPRLRRIGVPVPEIMGWGMEGDVRYILLSHIPGKDLGQVYAKMREDEKMRLARDLTLIQEKVDDLASPGGFGWTYADDPGKSESWKSHLVREVERARSNVAVNGVFDPQLGNLVLAAMRPLEAYFEAVPSKLFLDDITTKNVLIYNGGLSGIVDVDGMSLGDRMYALGLTRMALLNMDMETRYVDYWLDALRANATERRAVAWYTFAFCFSFMGEVGTRFDNGIIVPVSAAAIERLNFIFDSLSF